MNISFRAAQKLGFGLLVGITLLSALLNIFSMRHVVSDMHHKVEVQEVKERHFTQMALRFSMAGSTFHQARQGARLKEVLPEIVQSLNNIRSILTQLQALPLTEAEHEGVTKLKTEETRFRTALYVFLESGDDPAQETAAKAAADIGFIIDDAVDRAIYYGYRASEVIESSNLGIVASATRSANSLSLAAALATVLGLLVSLFVSRTFKRHLTAVRNATVEFGTGNFAFRIKSRFKDEMGKLALSVDDMGRRLEGYELQKQKMIAEMVSAKEVSDEQSRELAARAIELERSRKTAEAASRSKSQFLASMSHELRTPMNGVLGMTELLLISELTPKQRHLTKMARQSGELLLNIINDILDISKIEAGKLDLERAHCNLRALVEETVDLFAERAQRKGVELVCAIDDRLPAAVVGDALRLRQILTNLVNNAIKFTARGEVVVTVAVTEATAENVVACVEVRDTGIGIAPEVQERIFESFVQADGSTTRQYGGTGLGLSIARQLVEMMGGRMTIVSQPGLGSTFRFTMPFDIAVAPPPDRVRGTELAGVRVLIVDDNTTNREIVHAQCTSWNMVCRSTDRGADALAVLREAAIQGAPYHVIIVDQKMPEMDGLTLVRKIKADSALAGTSVVLLTSVGVDSTEASQAGVARSLTKPVWSDQLYQTLRVVKTRTAADAGVSATVLASSLSMLSGHVLVAEDNSVNQEVAREMLESLGCQVTAVANGSEAVAAVAQTSFDAVLMDMQMPMMDGLAATRVIREREAQTGRRLPIIALTANAFATDAETCFAVGMDEYLSKPFTLSQLHTRLARWLSAKTQASVTVVPQEPASRPAPDRVESRKPETAPPELVLEHKVLDALRALQRPGRPDVVTKILMAFLETGPRLLASMREALAHGDARMLHRVAHTLKSSSANVGAMTLSARCREVEALGRPETLTDAAAALDKLIAEYARVEAALNAELHADESVVKPEEQTATAAQPMPCASPMQLSTRSGGPSHSHF